MNDIKEIYKTAGVEYNEGYTLDTFEKEFSDAQSEKEKQTPGWGRLNET